MLDIICDVPERMRVFVDGIGPMTYTNTNVPPAEPNFIVPFVLFIA